MPPMNKTVPAATTGSWQERGAGRHVQRTPELWALALTTIHTAWLERRDRNPLIWTIPLAVIVACIGPR